MSREYSLRYRQQHEIVRSDLDPIHDVYGFFGLLAELTLAEKAASMLNVLIVEDDLSIADLLQTALKLEGYGVSGIARTVREAIESIAEQSPDFAVIDLRLAEGGCGTDVGVHLRRIVVNPGILYSTGNSNEIILTKAHGDAVMVKPYLMRDVGRGLTIIGQLAQSGETALAFPRSFRLLDPDSTPD